MTTRCGSGRQLQRPPRTPKSSLRSLTTLPLMSAGRAEASKAMTDNSVHLEKRGQAFWITINRPEKRNALNGNVIGGIRRGYQTPPDNQDARVISLTGAGDQAFCACADLQN